MRVAQLWRWLYVHQARRFSQMSDLSSAVRQSLEAAFTLTAPQVVAHQVSCDGTQKWLLRFEDEALVETVYIPDAQGRPRGALCVSSQVGCALGCRFCHTGLQGWVRNLTAQEIVTQFCVARQSLGELPITTLVFMGMGEPLLNCESVAEAIEVLCDGAGVGLSRRRVTVSTAGVAPHIGQVTGKMGVQLAVSLHGSCDESRTPLVPLNRKYPLKTLMAAVRAAPGVSNTRRVTFEYVLLDGVNDSQDEAVALVRLLRGIPAKVNLLEFNPWPGAPYRPSPRARMERFAAVIRRAGYASPLRTPRGQDIMAACGQLRTDTQHRRLSA